jgi:SPP1 family predicted phage head-tail adaptor
MPIAAGKLRHRITIQRETTTRDEYGSEVKTWLPLATVWASVEPLSPTAMSGVRELVGAGAEQSQDMVRVTIRPRDVTA